MGRLLQILGCVLMLAAVCAAAGGADRADAEILAPIARAIQAALQQAQNATPAPSPTPTPTPRPATIQRGGPVQFNISGSLSLGESSTTSAFGGSVIFTPSPSPNASSTPGPFPFQQASQTSQNKAELGAGLTADISRRTATTMTDLRIPFGFSLNGQSAIGYAQFLYSTPKYSLGYGSQQLLALGQLQMGFTQRGFSFIVPQRYGQATFFEGPAHRRRGRDRSPRRHPGAAGAGTARFTRAGSSTPTGPITGSAKTLTFGTARGGRNLDLILEGAWQTRIGRRRLSAWRRVPNAPR